MTLQDRLNRLRITPQRVRKVKPRQQVFRFPDASLMTHMTNSDAAAGHLTLNKVDDPDVDLAELSWSSRNTTRWYVNTFCTLNRLRRD